MKYTLFIFWMFFTMVLAISVVGWILFVPKDMSQYCENTPSTWMTIGRTLLNKL